MKDRIISKVFNGHQILFDKIETQIYLNATKTAKFFQTSKGNSKDVNEWLNSKATKEYLAEMSKIVTPEKFGRLVIVVNSGTVAERGTWIHKKLIVFFARWLSSEFAVWCDVQIEDIVASKNLEIAPKPKNLISVSDSELDRELKTLDYLLEKFLFSENEKRVLTNQVLERVNFPTLEIQPKRKTEKVFTLTQLLEDFQISFSPYEINLKLQSFGIIQRVSGYWFLENLKFGVNESYDNHTNPKYYKSTFQELLDIVL